MTQVLDAVYERGAFRPLAPPDPRLAEGQHVRLVVEENSSRAQSTPAEFDLDALLAMPRDTQSRILRHAAEAASGEYEEDLERPIRERQLTVMTALDAEDFLDESS